MLAIGSAAARTISGSIESTVWMTAASLNWRYASARSASAFASASPFVKTMPASALPSSVVCFGVRLGVDQDDPGLRLALRDRDRGLGLAGELDPLGVGLGRGDPGALLALGAADLRLGLGLGRADRGGEQLLLLAGGLELGQLGLLADDLLRRLGLGERPGLGGARLGRRDLRLGLGPPERHVALGVDLDLLRLGLADGGLLVGGRLRHPGVPLAAGGLLLADQVHVAGLVADRLDRERVDLEARTSRGRPWRRPGRPAGTSGGRG